MNIVFSLEPLGHWRAWSGHVQSTITRSAGCPSAQVLTGIEGAATWLQPGSGPDITCVDAQPPATCSVAGAELGAETTLVEGEEGAHATTSVSTMPEIRDRLIGRARHVLIWTSRRREEDDDVGKGAAVGLNCITAGS